MSSTLQAYFGVFQAAKGWHEKQSLLSAALFFSTAKLHSCQSCTSQRPDGELKNKTRAYSCLTDSNTVVACLAHDWRNHTLAEVQLAWLIACG